MIENVSTPEDCGFFSDKKIQRGFIRKVYAILCSQLIVTLCIICVFQFVEAAKVFVAGHPGIVILAFVLSFGLVITLTCFESIRRHYPYNIILLSIFTLVEGFLLGTICVAYEKSEILLAVGITALVAFSLTVFAFQTKIDFTLYNGILFVAVIVLMMFGFLAMFTQNKIVHLLYSCFGALLFSVYIVYDTQLMMGGNHAHQISPEDHIYAALNLYLDIIQLFIHILYLLNSNE